MCLAVPGKIVEKNGHVAKVSFGGAVKEGISLFFCPDAKVNDFCLVHAGSALQVIDEEEAKETISLLKQYGRNE